VEVIKFPLASEGKPAEGGASRQTIWRGRLKEWFCRLLNMLGVPGAIRDASIEDTLTGQKIEIRVGTLFTRISINGRDFYFSRLSGRFDGTGTGCG
jgi:hypothetical protein